MLSRRDLLISAGGIAAVTQAGCTTRLWTPPERPPFGDAHVHLFNMADLPAGNFLRYVYIPEHFPKVPGWAAALLDLIATVLRARTMTASEESSRLGQGLAGETITPTIFGLLIAAQIRARLGAGAVPPGPQGLALQASYRELNRGVAAAASTKSRLYREDEPSAEAIADIAEASELDIFQPGGSDKAKGFLFDSTLRRVLGWVYQMMLSRRGHLTRFLRRFAHSGRPVLLINHLVDYDLWLDETPLKGSDQFAQIMVMDRIARDFAAQVDVRTFAGFCPLKLAVERVRGGATTLSRLLDLHAQGKIHGFKLYPPMGFQPLGNAALQDRDFEPRDGRKSALEVWAEEKTTIGLGQALDDALSQFYAVCAARGIPIMAHSASSNGAGPAYSERANPALWRQVTATYPIRLTLGHLVDKVNSFIDAVKPERQGATGVWALDGALPLMDPALPGARVYGDLGFTEELLGQNNLSARFFRALQASFGRKDPDLTRILFGSDWIMLGLQRNHQDYLEAVLRGMRDARYTEAQRRNILELNLRRALA